MIILVKRPVWDIEPVCFEAAEGEMGIPIFDTAEHAEEFAEAYQELLGSGLETLELPNRALGQLLGKCRGKAEYVILKPRPQRASGGSVRWEMVEIGQFAEGLGESGL